MDPLEERPYCCREGRSCRSPGRTQTWISAEHNKCAQGKASAGGLPFTYSDRYGYMQATRRARGAPGASGHNSVTLDRSDDRVRHALLADRIRVQRGGRRVRDQRFDPAARWGRARVMTLGRPVGVDIAVPHGLGYLPQLAVEPQFLVVEEDDVASCHPQRVSASVARGGKQVWVADNVDAGAPGTRLDLAESCRQLPGNHLDPLL